MEELQKAIKTVSGDWLPVVDGVVLPRNPFDPDAPKLSERVPMIMGNTHDETNVPGGATMTWEESPSALDRAVHEHRLRQLLTRNVRYIMDDRLPPGHRSAVLPQTDEREPN